MSIKTMVRLHILKTPNNNVYKYQMTSELEILLRAAS
jgi:hypothetical protein